MSENRLSKEVDQIAENVQQSEKGPDIAQKEANEGKGDLVRQQSDDIRARRERARLSAAQSETSMLLGRPEIPGLVKGVAAKAVKEGESSIKLEKLVADPVITLEQDERLVAKPLPLPQIPGLDLTKSLPLPEPIEAWSDTVRLKDKTAYPGDLGKQRQVDEACREKWGKREFAVKADGSAEYKVEKGDTLWSIARDVLKQRHKDDPNYKPTAKEIQQEVNRIASESGIKDPNKIYPDQVIKIPKSEEDKKPPETDKKPPEQIGPIKSGDATLKPKDGAFNPLRPPGLHSEGEKDGYTVDIAEVSQRLVPGGYSREVYDGTLTRGDAQVPFHAEQTTDSQGRIVQSRVEYKGKEGASIAFQTPDGGKAQIDNVDTVVTRYNPQTGSYETSVVCKDGKTYQIQTGADGKVKSWNPSPPGARK